MSIKEVLERDHDEIDRLYSEVLGRLILKNHKTALERLDVFWARLAVHIRAEHHHLFPAVGRLAEEREGGDAEVGGRSELNGVIAGLRHDHDLFMRELAAAVKELRSAQTESFGTDAVLEGVRARVERVGDRLLEHNRVEEEKIYALDIVLASRPDAGELLRAIESELANLPPRFRSAL